MNATHASSDLAKPWQLRRSGEGDWNEGQFVESGVLMVVGGTANATERVSVHDRLKFLGNDGVVPAELASVHGLELRPRSPGMRGFVVVIDGSGVGAQVVGGVVPNDHDIPSQAGNVGHAG